MIYKPGGQNSVFKHNVGKNSRSHLEYTSELDNPAKIDGVDMEQLIFNGDTAIIANTFLAAD